MKPNFNILFLQNAVCKEKLKLHHLEHTIPRWQYNTMRIIFFSRDGESWPCLDGNIDGATYRSILEIGGLEVIKNFQQHKNLKNIDRNTVF